MPARPTRRVRWATNAAGGVIVEPPSGDAAAGWQTEQRPPAQYFNFLQNQTGVWVDFLSGPDLSSWTQRDWMAAGSPPVLSTGILLGVDRISADGFDVMHWVMVGYVAADTKPTILVSQRGNGWGARSNAPTSGVPYDFKQLGDYWWLVTSGGNHLYRTEVATGAIADPGETWAGQTLGAGPSGGKAIAYDSATGHYALIAISGGWYSLNGSTWLAWNDDPGRTGLGYDLVFDGVGWIGICDDAQILTATSVTDLWAAGAAIDSGTVADWRLTVGPDVVIAWQRNASGATVPWQSDDHGATWAEVPDGTLPAHTYRLAYNDGVWIAAGEGYPYLSQSNDLVAWFTLPLPLATDLSIDPELYEVATDGATWIAIGQGYTWRSGTARDVAGGALVPGNVPNVLANAAYLRGHIISTAAPSEGNVLAWSAISGWQPVAPSTVSVPWTAVVTPATVSTTDATQTTCGAYTVPTSYGVSLEISVVATKRDRSAVSGWRLLASAANAAGTVTQSTGSPLVDGPSNSGVTWSVDVDVSGTSVRVRVTGQAATTIDWCVTARVVGSTG